MPSVTLNGAEIHYEVDGRGPACLVLHGGLGIDATLYRRTLAPLADTLRLIFPDHRGNGRSGRVDLTTITIEQLADDAAALADALGIDRFHVLGHSYGGFVAQELALRHAQRVDALLLVSTTPGQLGRSETADDEQGDPPPPEVLALMSKTPGSDEEVRELMSALLPHYLHRVDAGAVAPLLDGTVYRSGSMVRGFEVLSRWSSVDRLPGVAAPTLLLAGRHDVFTSYPQSYRIAQRVRGASVVLFEDSGHFPWIEEPQRFFRTVRDWLTSVAGVSV